MQYKKSPNPKIEELTKSHTERTVPLDSIKAIRLEDGTRLCVWCQTNKLGTHHNQKYCGTECSNQAMAWAYPQKEQGLGYLLLKQDYCCNICQHDWKPFIEDNIIGKTYGTKGIEAQGWRERFVWAVIKRFKSRINRSETKHLRPEVDHIEPIYKGGQSIGLDNHQAICYGCHKAKSKVDNSGPRKKKLKASSPASSE